MSDSDSLSYLKSDFDPNSLTVPRLRSILVQYNITYPSTAKKAQLVKIFNDEILPQKRKIMKERERARRSSKGIVNADLRESLEVEENAAPPRKSRRSTRITSTKLKLEEDDEKSIFMRERTQSPTKKIPRANSKHARASDTETGTDLDTRRKSSRRSRKSETPTYILPEIEAVNSDIRDYCTEVPTPNQRESAFTSDNPFQSGSSPSGAVTEKRRKSYANTKERRKTSGYTPRRKTEIPQIDDGIHPPKLATFQAPSILADLKITDESRIEVSEEFTPEEQLELNRERVVQGDNSNKLLKINPRLKPVKSFSMKGPLWAIILSTLIGYLTWYRQERIAVGYCYVGRQAIPLISFNWEIPNWARILVEPKCEPCPDHAFCSDRMKAQCEQGFLLKAHPLSLAGLVPLVPTCEPDGLKYRRVRSVTDRAIKKLREIKANFECGNFKDESGSLVFSPEIDSNDLKREISKNLRSSVTKAEFEKEWDSDVLPEIINRDEVKSVHNGTQYKLSSTSLASLPLVCGLRRSLRNTVTKYRFKIGGIIIIILLLIYTRSVYISHQKTNATIPGLVSITLARLANQAVLHQQNNKFERWISIGQLRDDVLRDEHSIKKRESIWRKVRIVIETNANVRSSQKEDRNGEVSRVWEWIGAV